MKTDKYRIRFYRDWIKAQGLHSSRIAVKETDLQILTDKPLNENFLRERINNYRFAIEGYIAKERRFLTSLKPIEVELNAPLIVRKMARAAKLAGVGPMAAVAGAIAESLAKELSRRGFKEVIIENGGDIFLKTIKPRKVGIYAGKSRLWQNLCLKIRPEYTPISICASSGRVGHSLSFGCADSVVILSKDAFLADAVATATCNRIKRKADLKPALNFARSVKGISGIVVIFKNNLASWGEELEFETFS